MPLVASSGLRDGLEAAHESEEALYDLVQSLIAEVTAAMFCPGCGTLGALLSPGILQKL